MPGQGTKNKEQRKRGAKDPRTEPKQRQKQKKGKSMARVELPFGIVAIHGRLGDLIFRTNKTTGKVTVHLAPQKKKGYGKSAT